MRRASIDVKTSIGKYRVYRIEFQDVRHYNNWCNAMERKWGHKIIGVRFDDGHPDEYGFKLKQND